jgi:hypothetical protein
MLMGTTEAERDEVMGGWRKLYNDELWNEMNVACRCKEK